MLKLANDSTQLFWASGIDRLCHSPELLELSRESTKEPTEHGLKGLWFPLILFVLIAFLIVWDIAEDLAAGTTTFHVVMELIMMLASVAGVFYFWNQLRIAQRIETELKQNLKNAHAETTRWQEQEQDLLYNLRKAINKQFTLWDLLPREKEIAFYLLKGLSLKEIAVCMGGTYLSIKQQAHVLYRKAGLGGRAELSAFFLGGLLQPDSGSTKAAGPKFC